MSKAVADLVIKAQAGDHKAFGELVLRFQDLAFAYALRWLGDAESARDAAQDAFVSAFVGLDQLREPAAFAGWFRRVLLKHCDRRTRRLEAPALDSDSDGLLPDQQLLESREREWLRSAVEKLPEHERIVVALHYFGDESQQDVADFLELPLSTLKKRLYSARRRLEARRAEMETYRPSTTTAFADKIKLFLAIRSGDIGAASAALERQPELLEARELWTVAEALEANLPLAHKVTPLVAASARGDRPMVELLLARGARPDGPGGHYSNESALWTAALHGHADIVELLLAAGADPNLPNNVGHTPVHVAALHGHEHVLGLLVGGGGKLEQTAENGLSARDYRLQRREMRLSDAERLETGIKAIDLFAPLTARMLVRVQGAGGTGLMVLMAELARRLANSGKRSIWITWEPMPWQKGELRAFVREMGIEDCTTVMTDPLQLPRIDADDVALFVFEREGHTAEVEASLPALARRAGPTFVVEPWATITRTQDPQSELRAPFTAQISTSVALAARGIFPAIDPERSHSSIAVEAEHRRIQQQARELLRREDERAERARAFFAQPFSTWQQHSGRPGEIVPLLETLSGIDAILRG